MGACGLAAGLSLLQSQSRGGYTSLIVIVFLVIAWLGIQKLEYDEFGAARRVLFGGQLQNMLNTQISLKNLERAISQAETMEECWSAVRDSCRQFGFDRVELYLAGHKYGQEKLISGGNPSWYLYVPLAGSACALISRKSDSPIRPHHRGSASRSNPLRAGGAARGIESIR